MKTSFWTFDRNIFNQYETAKGAWWPSGSNVGFSWNPGSNATEAWNFKFENN